MKTTNYASNNMTNSVHTSISSETSATPSFWAEATETPAPPAESGKTHGVSAVLRNGVALQMAGFHVYVDPSRCVDSLLFDSDTTIAGISAQSADGRFFVAVDLMVRGAVSIAFRGKTYNVPSQFPEELKEIIRKKAGNWNAMSDEEMVDLDEETLDHLADTFEPDDECEDHLYLISNNWFEYIYTLRDNDRGYEDGIMCEENFAAMNRFELEDAMLTVAKEIVDKALESDVPAETVEKRRNALQEFYIKSLHQIGSQMYSCNECGGNLRATDKVIDCADCGAIICERCVRAGMVSEHVCVEDEDFEV